MFTPDYSIKMYREDWYKVVRFDTPLGLRIPAPRTSAAVHDSKLAQSLSRARSMIIQIAMCNDWEWFFTCTLDELKHDRYSLSVFTNDFPQWVRDYRKKYKCDLRYLIVPEQHKDGAWHVHGFLSGIPADHITDFVPGIHPQRLIDKGYKNWGRCGNKFGYCSLDRIKDGIAVSFYVTKYITKEMANSAIGLGCHLYYCSIGLKRAVPLGYVYGRQLLLDLLVTQEHQFCSTGFTDVLDWALVADLLGPDAVLKFPEYEPEPESVFLMSNVQISIDEYISRGGCSGNIPVSCSGASGSNPDPAPM